jgi:hypothetical protein
MKKYWSCCGCGHRDVAVPGLSRDDMAAKLNAVMMKGRDKVWQVLPRK